MATEKDVPIQTTALRRTSVQAMNLLAGEIAGTAAEVAILSNIHKVDAAAPGITGAIKGFIKNIFIKPLMQPIEWSMQYAKGIEGEKEYEARMALPKDERAQILAETTYRYTAAMAGCYTVLGSIQHMLNKASGVQMTKGSTAMLLGADAVIHLGSIMVMGSPAATRNTQNVKQAISCVFKSFGIDDRRANDMANYGVAVQFPNYITYVADVGILHAMNKRLVAAQHLHP